MICHVSWRLQSKRHGRFGVSCGQSLIVRNSSSFLAIGMLGRVWHAPYVSSPALDILSRWRLGAEWFLCLSVGHDFVFRRGATFIRQKSCVWIVLTKSRKMPWSLFFCCTFWHEKWRFLTNIKRSTCYTLSAFPKNESLEGCLVP